MEQTAGAIVLAGFLVWWGLLEIASAISKISRQLGDITVKQTVRVEAED